MLKLNISKKASKFLKKLPPKHGKQLAVCIRALQENPRPQDYSHLKGVLSNFLRVDSGEYRIIYETAGDTLYIILIGKRNDDEVYRQMVRLV
ncbi:MAG: type II toxin-antitoxin system RelE/ParE family toxin [Elusimicrobia bacterium]|nr:type II toxin-antitoxin system RelE/ParE family toxin [Elusimicrobiota bacterium]